jgi:uncharacterized protein
MRLESQRTSLAVEWQINRNFKHMLRRLHTPSPQPSPASGVRAGVRHPTQITFAAAALLGLIGCVGSSAPVQLYQLRAEAPITASAASTSTATNTTSKAIWQLALPVKVPDYLDRDAVLVPQGQAGLQALNSQRWAEPLRDAVPRLLRADLGALLGEAQVWSAPLPPNLNINKLLRVELLALEANAQRNAVVLRARWSITNITAIDISKPGEPPQVQTATLNVPSASSDVDALVAAHRLALWRLAERIAGTTPR